MNNVELTRGFEAFERGDVEAVRRTLHPDIEVHTSAEVGEEGTYRGPDGFDRWVAVWLEAWEEFRTEVQEVEEVDDRNVLVHVNQWGRGRDSGLRVDRTVTFLVTVQDGKTTRLHIYGDREAALAAAARDEQRRAGTPRL